MNGANANSPGDPAAGPGPFETGDKVGGPNFAGDVRLAMLAEPAAPGQPAVANVTFGPGARNSWHVHDMGQTLLVTAGSGLYQVMGQAPRRIRPGEAIVVPALARHWHGASPNEGVTHLAVTPGETRWEEPVAEDDYLAAAAEK